MGFHFRSRKPTPEAELANLAPAQQRRVIEYGSGDSEPPPPGRTAAGAPRAGSSLSWVDRALDGLEPLAE